MSSLLHLSVLSASRTGTVHRHGRAWHFILALAVSSCAVPVPATSLPSVPAPTNGGGRDFGKIEAEVFSALNRARTDPAGTSASLHQLESYFDGNLLKLPAWPVPVRTVEGVVAVRQAVSAVASQRAVPALTLNPALSRAARDHADDQASTGYVGHTGSDGSTVATRV